MRLTTQIFIDSIYFLVAEISNRKLLLQILRWKGYQRFFSEISEGARVVDKWTVTVNDRSLRTWPVGDRMEYSLKCVAEKLKKQGVKYQCVFDKQIQLCQLLQEIIGFHNRIRWRGNEKSYVVFKILIATAFSLQQNDAYYLS